MMKSIRFTEVTVFAFFLTASIAQAAVLGTQGPLVPDSNDNWRKFCSARSAPLPAESGDDKSCYTRSTKNLRELFFEHFRYYVEHSKSQVGEVEIARFAKVLGMAPHESSGASAAVTDMKGTGSRSTLRYFFDTDNARAKRSEGLYSTIGSVKQLMSMETIQWNEETNFGLLQMSANRLYIDFGKDEAKIATETLNWMRTLYTTHPEEVIERCGTKVMFKDSDAEIRETFDTLQKCSPGWKSKAEVQCFGKWAVLCPHYNVTLALIAPPAYFATRYATPLCAKTFRKILNDVNLEPKVATPPTNPTIIGPMPAQI